MAPFFFMIYLELLWYIRSFFIHLKIDWMPYFFWWDGGNASPYLFTSSDRQKN